MQVSALKASPLNTLINRAPFYLRWPAKLVLLNEGSLGNEHALFAQSVGSVWLSKAVMARSWAEQAEQFFLEFVETALFFYAVPIAANKVFKPLALTLSGSTKANKIPEYLFDKKAVQTLTEKLGKTIGKEALQHAPRVNAVKAAIILASLSIIAFEYSLNHIKNLITENVFKKNKFSDVVGLSDGKHDSGTVSPVAQKAKRRIVECALAAGLSLTAALGMAVFGAKVPFLKNVASKLVKYLDLSHTFKSGNGISTIAFGTPLFLATVWLGGVVSYLDASRDKLETQEILNRVALVVAPYYSFGKQLVIATAATLFGRKVPDILDVKKLESFKPEGKFQNLLSNVFGKTFTAHFVGAKETVKPFEDLARQSLESAEKVLSKSGKPVTQSAVENTAAKLFRKILPAKNSLFLVPYLTGIAFVGMLTTYITQRFTQIRFERAQAGQKQQASLITKKEVEKAALAYPGFLGAQQANPFNTNAWAANSYYQYA